MAIVTVVVALVIGYGDGCGGCGDGCGSYEHK